MSSEILFLNPVCKHNIWGGTRLREEFGYEEQGSDIGECWGISAHPNGDATVTSGEYAGMKLSEVWDRFPELFGNLGGDKFPLLVKLIDAKDDLSIQVHPDDVYAGANENGASGKTECWYVLDCPEDASLVIGHNAKSREELQALIQNEKWSELIRRVPVKKGDFIQIDPGTVHAIGSGFLLLETQQNSDMTYRVYDYGRLSGGKTRELHIGKSIDVITVPAEDAARSVKSTSGLPVNQLALIHTCQYYKIFGLKVEKSAAFEQDYPFLNMTVTDGEGTLNGHPVKKGNHFILPCGFGKVEIRGDLQIIASTI